MSKKNDVSIYPWSPLVRGRCRRPQPIGGPSLTQQEFKDQCDINHQIELFKRAGRPLPVYGVEATMDDVQDLHATYIDAVNAVREVEDAFSQLPSKVRSRFNNSPMELAQFLADSANRQEAYDLGLVQTPPPALSSPPSQTPKAPEEPEAKAPVKAPE